MEMLSVDIRFMQKTFDDFKYMLFATCKIINFILAILMKTGAEQAVAKALIGDCPQSLI